VPEPSALPPLTQLYREHFDAVWATLRRLGVPPGSLEDAVHDVFMVVHRQRERFEGRSTVRTWLLGIARRIAHRYRRAHARTQRRHQALATVIPPTSHPDDDIARQEGWHALQGFLDELDEDKRAAFVLGELERLSRQELGDALGVSPNTAWSRLRAARARFKVRFSEPGLGRALAAGRHAEPAPAESRERVWLVVAGSLRELAGPAAAAGSAWSAKGVLVTLGLAAAGLGAVTGVARATYGSERAVASVGASSGQHEDGAGPARTSRE
jgi:RNA polymerase sigma-70 factor (ECF subfamily)